VAHRVLDERQERHRRAAQSAHVFPSLDFEAEAVRHARAHELEIGAHEVELLAEGRDGVVEPRHGGAKVGDEVAQDFRRLRRAGLDESLHVREGIEKEVRRHLRLQQVQSRIEREAVGFAAREFERKQALARQCLLLPDEGAERDPG
jgi:hypothetical protein